jgi:hypothetical protein
MNKELFENEGQLYVVHRKVLESKVNPKYWGINSTDINKMVKCYVEWYRSNCKTIDKVFLANGTFLFCELIPSVEFKEINND